MGRDDGLFVDYVGPRRGGCHGFQCEKYSAFRTSARCTARWFVCTLWQTACHVCDGSRRALRGTSLRTSCGYQSGRRTTELLPGNSSELRRSQPRPARSAALESNRTVAYIVEFPVVASGMHKGGARMEAFTVAVRQSDSACQVTLAGELDAATAPILRDALTTVHGRVSIDCEQLSFADSSGIAEFLTLARRVESIGLEKPSNQLRRSLEILDLTVVLGVDERAT